MKRARATTNSNSPFRLLRTPSCGSIPTAAARPNQCILIPTLLLAKKEKNGETNQEKSEKKGMILEGRERMTTDNACTSSSSQRSGLTSIYKLVCVLAGRLLLNSDVRERVMPVVTVNELILSK